MAITQPRIEGFGLIAHINIHLHTMLTLQV